MRRMRRVSDLQASKFPKAAAWGGGSSLPGSQEVRGSNPLGSTSVAAVERGQGDGWPRPDPSFAQTSAIIGTGSPSGTQPSGSRFLLVCRTVRAFGTNGKIGCNGSGATHRSSGRATAARRWGHSGGRPSRSPPHHSWRSATCRPAGGARVCRAFHTGSTHAAFRRSVPSARFARSSVANRLSPTSP
jgi:hypothetical protein